MHAAGYWLGQATEIKSMKLKNSNDMLTGLMQHKVVQWDQSTLACTCVPATKHSRTP